MSRKKDLKNLKVEDLKNELRKKKLPQTGKKDVLVNRLELYQMSKKTLQEKVKKKNLPITGTKATLVRRLETNKASPPKLRLKEPRRTSPVRCTIGKGKQKRKYYFDPDTGKRISKAEADRRGKEKCLTSEKRAEQRKRKRKVTPKRKLRERVSSRELNELSKQLEQQTKVVEFLSSLEGLSPNEMGARLQELGEETQKLKSLRESVEEMSTTLEDVEEMPSRSVLSESLKEMDVTDVDDLPPNVSLSLSRTEEEVKADMLEESAKGMALIKIMYGPEGRPFLTEIVKENFAEIPEDTIELYDMYPVDRGEQLATVTMEALNNNRPSRYRPYPTFVSAKPIPPPGWFSRLGRFVGKLDRFGDELGKGTFLG